MEGPLRRKPQGLTAQDHFAQEWERRPTWSTGCTGLLQRSTQSTNVAIVRKWGLSDFENDLLADAKRYL
jgi:hypothetical protein